MIGLAAALPTTWRRVVAVTFGLLLGAIVIVKVFDLGFRSVFARPFDLLNDWYFLGPGVGVLGDSIGRPAAITVAVLAGVLAVGVLVLLPVCVLRLTSYAARHRTGTGRTVIAPGQRLGAGRRPRAAGRTGGQRRVHQRVVAGLRRGAAGALRPQGPRGLRPAARCRPLRAGAGQPAPHEAPRQGCAARLRGELRPGGGRGHELLPRDRRSARRRHATAGRRGVPVAQRLVAVADVRRGELARTRDLAVRGVGEQPAALRPAVRPRPADA